MSRKSEYCSNLSAPNRAIGLRLPNSESSKGGYRKLMFAHVGQAQRCVQCTFQGSFSVFSISKRNLIRIKTGLDTYLIRIQTRPPLSRYPPYDYSKHCDSNRESQTDRVVHDSPCEPSQIASDLRFGAPKFKCLHQDSFKKINKLVTIFQDLVTISRIC